MSTDEFIYSVINSDNVAQLDLNVIANTLASVDSLIRQIKSQQVENENLKKKISSLRDTAVQIKELYKDELDKNKKTVNREEYYIRQVETLEARALAAENARVNAELSEKETVAELERQLQNSKHRYDTLACDMVKNCSLLLENNLLPSDQQLRFREVKSYVQSLVQCGQEVPEDVVASLNRKKNSRRRRKSVNESRDQATMTVCSSSISVGVNTVTQLSCQSTVSTSTHDLVADDILRVCDESSVGVKSAKPEPAKTTLVDKSTMYSSSTITRSTCTSAFIKKVDVGVNFPEAVPKFINDILMECVVELPSLLSPILDDISVHKESVHTQTEPLSIEISQPKTQGVHRGTITSLRNIRRKLDYTRKTENLSDSSHLVSSIKKEESVSPATSILNLPAAFHQSEDYSRVNPRLTKIWAALGETMFKLLGSGQILDSQCYNTSNSERMSIITNLNKVFEAASAAIISDEEQYGNIKIVTSQQQKDQSESACANHEKNMHDYEEEACLLDERQEEENGPLNDILSETFSETDTNDVSMSISESFTDSNAATVNMSSICGTETTILSENSVSLLDVPTECENQQLKKNKVTVEMEQNLVVVSEANNSSSPAVSCSDLDVGLLTAEDESNDFSTLMEQNINTACSIDTKRLEGSEFEENDEIANELRLMEEGNLSPNEVFPSTVNFGTLPESSEKRYLHVDRDEDSTSSAENDHDDGLVVECSPTRSLPRSSCTTIGSNGTLISPIKVKETNELVKDQFKTPTSPAISKRKLRDRPEGTPPKRGRMSPTTETLLEDDWDRKLLHIKDYFSFPTSLIPIDDSQNNKKVDANKVDGCEEDKTTSEIEELCAQPMTAQLIQTDSKKVKDSNQQGADIVQAMQTEPAGLEISPKSPTKDSVVNCSQWNDFKVPLTIDTGSTETTGCSTDSPESPLPEDSPMSPVPELEANRSFSCDDSPMSPPMDSRISIYSETVEPKIIPLEHACASRFPQKYPSTPIAKTIARYSKDRRAEVLRKIAPEASKTEAALIRNVVEVINNYIKDEWTLDNLKQRGAELVELTKDTRIISLAIIKIVISYGDMPVDVQCSPPAPPLPRIVQQLVLLVKTLNEILFILDKVLLQEIDRKVFTLKSNQEKLDDLIAATYLYIGISDCNRLYGCTARLYIYKSLYYFNFKGLPLVYHVLKAFPHALPKKSSLHYDNSDAMVSTIRTILMNLNYMERSNSQNAHLYRKSELLKLLKFFYGYQQGSPTYEELIVNLVDKIKANKLRNVDYCLILVAKRKGYEWSKTHIILKYLYPLLNDYLKRLDADGTLNEQVACLIFIISSILKTSPNNQDVTGIMQILGGIVEMTNGNPKVQETAVAALLRMTRFGFADIYERLCKWCPKYEVSIKTKLMLATFVHRKEQRFWQRLDQGTIV